MAFNERKVAQMAAYLLKRGGGRMPHMKLLKLLYLADRESLSRHDEPMTGDAMFSLKYGPVLSRTLDLMNGNSPSEQDEWESWISDRENHQVALRDPDRALNRASLGALSEDDIEVLSAVWEKFGGMTQFELAQWTHDNCGEWEDPGQSSFRISYHSIFVALGRDVAVARELAAEIESQHSASRLLAKY